MKILFNITIHENMQLQNVLTPGQKLTVGNAVHGKMGISDQIYTIKPVHRRMQSPLRQAINRL